MWHKRGARAYPALVLEVSERGLFLACVARNACVLRGCYGETGLDVGLLGASEITAP